MMIYGKLVILIRSKRTPIVALTLFIRVLLFTIAAGLEIVVLGIAKWLATLCVETWSGFSGFSK